MKWVCTERGCHWSGSDELILRATNPFSETGEDTIHGCPDCRSVGTLVGACDAEGCTKEGTNGTPTPQGYRLTCYEHRPKE